MYIRITITKFKNWLIFLLLLSILWALYSFSIKHISYTVIPDITSDSIFVCIRKNPAKSCNICITITPVRAILNTSIFCSFVAFFHSLFHNFTSHIFLKSIFIFSLLYFSQPFCISMSASLYLIWFFPLFASTTPFRTVYQSTQYVLSNVFRVYRFPLSYFAFSALGFLSHTEAASPIAMLIPIITHIPASMLLNLISDLSPFLYIHIFSLIILPFILVVNYNLYITLCFYLFLRLIYKGILSNSHLRCFFSAVFCPISYVPFLYFLRFYTIFSKNMPYFLRLIRSDTLYFHIFYICFFIFMSHITEYVFSYNICHKFHTVSAINFIQFHKILSLFSYFLCLNMSLLRRFFLAAIISIFNNI